MVLTKGASDLRRHYGEIDLLEPGEQVRSALPFVSTGTPSSAGESTAGAAGVDLIAASSSLVCLALMPLALYRVLPRRAWLALDVLGLHHHVRTGAWSINQPTRWGGALTLAFVPMALLVALALASQGVAVELKASVIPVSTLPVAEQAQLRGTVELGLVVHGATAAECVAGLAVIAPPPGFNLLSTSAPPLTTLVSESAASACRALRLRCTDCALVGGASLLVSLPWRASLVEWQLAHQTPRAGLLLAASGAPSVSGVLAAPTSRVAPSGCEMYGSPGTPLPATTVVTLSVTPSLLVDEARSARNSSGYAVSFVRAEAAEPARACLVVNESKVELKFSLSVSPVVFLQSTTPKQTPLQIAASIASTLMTLLAIFGALLKWTERLLPARWLRLPGDHDEEVVSEEARKGELGAAGGAISLDLKAAVASHRLKVLEESTLVLRADLAKNAADISALQALVLAPATGRVSAPVKEQAKGVVDGALELRVLQPSRRTEPEAAQSATGSSSSSSTAREAELELQPKLRASIPGIAAPSEAMAVTAAPATGGRSPASSPSATARGVSAAARSQSVVVAHPPSVALLAPRDQRPGSVAFPRSSAASGAGSGGGWVEAIDSASGQSYWYNSAGQTRWSAK